MPTHPPRWLAALVLGVVWIAASAAWAQVECLDRYTLEDGIERLADGADQVTLPMMSRCVSSNATWVVADIQALRRAGAEGIAARNNRERRAARDRGKRALKVRVDGNSVVIGVRNRASLFLTRNRVYTWFFLITFTPKGRSTSGAAGGVMRGLGEFGCAHFLYLSSDRTVIRATDVDAADQAFDGRLKLSGRGVKAVASVVGANKSTGTLLNANLHEAPHYAIWRWNQGARDALVRVKIDATIAGVSTQHEMYLQNVCPAPPVALRNGFGVRLHAGMPFIGAGVGVRREFRDWRWSLAGDLLWQHPLNVLFPDSKYHNTLNAVVTPRLGTQNVWMGLSVGAALRDLPGDAEPLFVAIPHVTLMSMGGTLGVTIGAAYYGVKDTKMQPWVGLEFDLMGTTDGASSSNPQFTNRLQAVEP